MFCKILAVIKGIHSQKKIYTNIWLIRVGLMIELGLLTSLVNGTSLDSDGSSLQIASMKGCHEV